MPNPDRPRTPDELARAIGRVVGAHRIDRIVGLRPVSPPEGHAFYAFVVLRDEGDDALALEAKLQRRIPAGRPRVDYWVMGRSEWEQSVGSVGHPARTAQLDGDVLWAGDLRRASGSVA
ncbi:MAG TPA: hypothetical protein VHG51_15200 [Longimicrobiaceae bacterium]|nr:hypothetical protein [Longimicrobiaceae bacterium]